MKKIKVSFVLPCLNEELTLGDTIHEIKSVIRKYKYRAEIIVVDNGSVDSSVDIALKCGVKVVHCDIRGYGSALRCGFMAATGDYIIMADADSTYHLYDSSIIVSKLEEGYDFVIGNRYLGGYEKGATSFSHYYGVKFLSYLGRCKYEVNVGDFHCGLRGFRRSLLDTCSFETTGMEFATEMIDKFANYKIYEFPTILRQGNKMRKVKLRTIRDGFRHLFYIIRS